MGGEGKGFLPPTGSFLGFLEDEGGMKKWGRDRLNSRKNIDSKKIKVGV